MKQYKIVGKSACIGAGMILNLTKQQAETRLDCLTPLDKNYVVNTPIYFKKGEIIGVVSGNVTKSLITVLKETTVPKESNNSSSNSNVSGKNTDNQMEGDENVSSDFPKIKHVGFGNYDVYNIAGEKITDKPVTKTEAEKLLENLNEE